MSLYIKLSTRFFTNRKTIKLHFLIGDDAYWIPQKLWVYAAENQPDGDFSGYAPYEISMLLGYSKDIQALLDALKQSGFLDPDTKIHDWQEHNGFHMVYSSRAKKAAKARWEKEKVAPKEREELRESESESDMHLTHASSIRNASSIAASTKKNTKESNVELFPKTPEEELEEILKEKESDKTYEGIDVRREYGKMVNWCRENNAKPSRKRFTNWLNRIDKPLPNGSHYLKPILSPAVELISLEKQKKDLEDQLYYDEERVRSPEKVKDLDRVTKRLKELRP